MSVFFCLCVFWRESPLIGSGSPHSRGFLITHNDATQSVGLLWTSDQLVAETLPDNTKHSQQTDIHAPRWDSNPQSRQASGRRPTSKTARPPPPAMSGLIC